MDKDDHKKNNSAMRSKNKSVKRYDYLTRTQRSYFINDLSDRRIDQCQKKH